MKTLAIIGSGHLGQQIAHYAISDNHFKDVVFFDDFTSESIVNGFQVLGNSNDIISEYQKESFNEILIGIGYKHLSVRKQLFDKFLNKIPFGKIIHSSSWVDKEAIVNKGCVVYPNCCIDSHAIIDTNTILNISCTVAHDTYVGKHCFLSPRVALAGYVKIEDQCFLGIN
jgi:UDP-3-O-[3-hydroxymyristoyl] glucosamine N-acyltransferase